MDIYSFKKGALCNELLRIAGNEPVVQFLCIGTDLLAGDSLGPMVGHYLTKKRSFPYAVYGTITDTVNARNVEAVWNRIKFNAYTIAIDAAAAKPERVGIISVTDSPFKPGSGVGKNLPLVGHASIKGTTLQNGMLYVASLGRVITMAEYIASEIALFSKKKTQPVLRQIAMTT